MHPEYVHPQGRVVPFLASLTYVIRTFGYIPLVVSLIWLIILGEFKVTVLGILIMWFGSYIIEMFLMIPIGVGMLANKITKSSTYLSSFLFYVSHMLSFAIFYLFAWAIVNLSMYVYSSCQSWMPCILLAYGLMTLTPVYTLGTTISILHSFSIIVAYTIIFVTLLIGGLNYEAWSIATEVVITFFILVSLIEAGVSVHTIKAEEEWQKQVDHV